MGKIKSVDTLALNKSEQKKVLRSTNTIKKQIESGEINIRDSKKEEKVKATEKRGLVYLGHLPHGFFEDEISDYFKQFGNVTNVKVCRSRKTGNSKGYGYVEFLHPEVAQIAADTMNNYLMFKKRIIAKYIPSEKRPRKLFFGKSSTQDVFSLKTRRSKQLAAKNKSLAEGDHHLKRNKSSLKKLSKKLEKLDKYGISYILNPADAPKDAKSDSVTHFFEADPYDSDVEFKVPVKSKSSKKTVPKEIKDQTVKSKEAVKKATSSILTVKTQKEVVNISDSSRKASRMNDLIEKTNKKKPIEKTKKTSIKGITKPKKKLLKLNEDTIKNIASQLIKEEDSKLVNFKKPTKKTVNKSTGKSKNIKKSFIKKK